MNAQLAGVMAFFETDMAVAPIVSDSMRRLEEDDDDEDEKPSKVAPKKASKSKKSKAPKKKVNTSGGFISG